MARRGKKRLQIMQHQFVSSSSSVIAVVLSNRDTEQVGVTEAWMPWGTKGRGREGAGSKPNKDQTSTRNMSLLQSFSIPTLLHSRSASTPVPGLSGTLSKSPAP